MNRVVVVGVVLLCGACTAASGGAGPEVPDVELDFSGGHVAAMEAAYPVPYGFSRVSHLIEGDGENRWQVSVVIGKATAECMRDAGYEYPDIRWSKDQIVKDWVRPRHVALTIEDAEREAYGPRPTFNPPPDIAPVELTGEARAKYDTIELDCVVRGIESGFYDYDAYEVARTSLEVKVNEFEVAFGAAAPVRALVETWAECMRDAGYDYPDPEQARALGARAPYARTVAIEDARCRERTDFDAEWWRLYSSAEAGFMVDNEALILDVYNLRRVPE